MLLELWILLSMIMSTAYRLLLHDELVVGEIRKLPAFRSVFTWWFRVCVCFLAAFYYGFGFERYGKWYEQYSDSHSILLAMFINLLVLGVLWAFKQGTFHAELNPSVYRDMSGPYRINMKIPLILNAVFYGFIFLTPTMPFFWLFTHMTA